MTFCTVQSTDVTQRNAGKIVFGFLLAVSFFLSAIQPVEATEYTQPPYANYDAFPVPSGGCDIGITWCDTFDPATGMMHLSDFPLSGQYDESYVEWNMNKIWGNSPTAYYPLPYPVYWGSTWDAVGTIVQTAWPFHGDMEVGGILLECSDNTPDCTSGQYLYKGLLGVHLTSDDVKGKVAYRYQSSPQKIYQEADHLYTEVPIGYTGAFADNCENSCYGAGYTDFGLNGNYMLVRNLYAFPEE